MYKVTITFHDRGPVSFRVSAPDHETAARWYSKSAYYTVATITVEEGS